MHAIGERYGVGDVVTPERLMSSPVITERAAGVTAIGSGRRATSATSRFISPSIESNFSSAWSGCELALAQA